MVCKDMDTAVRLSKVAGHISFVTIQGDQVNKKGTMTGGYIDKTRYGILHVHLPIFSVVSCDAHHMLFSCCLFTCMVAEVRLLVQVADEADEAAD